MRYLMTHSLLYAWIYAMKENPFEDATSERDPMGEFMQVLRREPTETNEAMQNGIDFENLVTDIIHNCGDRSDKWWDAAVKVADEIRDSQLQFRASSVITVDGIELVLYGRLDALKAGTVFDIKFSKSYDRGKYFGSTQHPVYLKIVPEATQFVYIVSNGTEVWHETYRREETADIVPIIRDFFSWLQANDLFELYKEKWQAAA
ncbi:MAG: hypothetical protein ACI3VY_01885 [Faecousia sp.]